MSELSDRKRLVLRAIIEEYGAAGQPVGSRALTRRADMSFSAATLRNEMADLEEGGFLQKTHSSSGRKPTQRAYRFYVDELLRVEDVSDDVHARIWETFAQTAGEVGDLCEAAASLLSDLTGQVALVEAPGMENVPLQEVQMLRVSRQTGLVVLIAAPGVVREQLIPLPEEIGKETLEELASQLTDMARGTPLGRICRMADAWMGRRPGQKDVMYEVFSAINRARNVRSVFLQGQENIWRYPEYRDAEKARRILTFLGAGDKLGDLLASDADGMEFSIRIGSEVEAGLLDLSMVSTSYRAAPGSVGSFGVLGPARMDYGRVLSFLRCVRVILSSRLSGLQ